MYMAKFRLARHRDVRVQDSTGEVVAHSDIREGENPLDVLNRLYLRPFGPEYGLADARAFMVAVEPVMKTVQSGPVDVGLDFFHRQVVLCLDDKSVRFENQSQARHTAQAIMQAAAKGDQVWGGGPT